MNTTTNLGLKITNNSNISFADWRKAINGENDGVNDELSNMQKIDQFAGEVNEKLGDIETALDTILGV